MILTDILVSVSLLIGLILAVPPAVLRTSKNIFIQSSIRAYVYFFRGNPLLVQMLIIYYGLGQFEAMPNSLLWPLFKEAYFCALLAFTLNTAAYTNEITRGAIEAAPRGAVEAARAAGMSRLLMLRRIVLPGAFRRALPQYSNEIIFMLHGSPSSGNKAHIQAGLHADEPPDFPIPPACLAATVELRGITEVSHALAAGDEDNIFFFLQRRGFIGGRAPDLPELINPATPLTGVAHVKADVPGVVVFFKKAGDRLAKSDLIAEIINPLATDPNNRVHPVTSPTAGVLFARNVDHYALPGRIPAKIAGPEPLKKEGRNLLTL